MNRKQSIRLSVLTGALALALPLMASAQIKVGVTVASTGPAASLGIPERNTVALLPTEIAGQKVEYIVLDDGTDTTAAVRNIRKLVTDDKVDVVVGTSVRPRALAMVAVPGGRRAPMGVQDPAERSTDGWRTGRRHGQARHQDAGIHRLQRRLRRRLAQCNEGSRGSQGHQDGGRGALQPQRHQRDRTSAEA